jgi:hypothetical protein
MQNDKMTFEEILRSEYYPIVESIEHGCSDPTIIEYLKKELFILTGWTWID